jgi:hypothetical protein
MAPTAAAREEAIMRCFPGGSEAPEAQQGELRDAAVCSRASTAE